jgi:hypothetical protein
MTESQVERVRRRLTEAVGQGHNPAMASRRAEAERARRRGAAVGAVGFASPSRCRSSLWHRVIADIASEFRLDAAYLVTGWTPWVLMALGLCCFVPVVLEDWRDPTGASTAAAPARGSAGASRCTCLGFALATPGGRRSPTGLSAA